MTFSEEIVTFAHLGRALWTDPTEGEPAAVEVLSGVSLLNLEESSRYERAARLLLERARRSQGPEHLRFDAPFYRLSPRERFLLVSVHVGSWSYDRVARVLGEDSASIEEALWTTRMRVASGIDRVRGAYPVGSAVNGPNCPEYRTDRPWTQRFMDEELTSAGERWFLQNHLMACEPCRRSLERCRDVYYAVDKLIPRLSLTRKSDESFVSGLRKVKSDGSRVALGMGGLTVQESLAVFLSRGETKLALLAGGALVILSLLMSR